MGLARENFHCLVDGELFLPESWDADRDRCREAGIPDSLTYQPKWKIALDLLDRANANGIRFDWLTFDEGYGSKPELLRELTARKQFYVAEVPRSLGGWLEPPRVVTRKYRRNGRGRGRKTPRLASGSQPVRRVDELLQDPKLRDQPWQQYRVKDGEKGPMVWECKHVMFTVKGADGLPGERLHLLVARNVLDQDEVKFFVSNAPPETRVETLLLVAFSRWKVERCFEDQKSEIGLDQYEGRRYLGLKRHLMISAVSYLFLARVREEWAKKKPGDHGLPTAHGDGRIGTIVELVVTSSQGGSAGEGGQENRVGAELQCGRPKEPHEGDQEKAAGARHQAHHVEKVSLGHYLAL